MRNVGSVNVSRGVRLLLRGIAYTRKGEPIAEMGLLAYRWTPPLSLLAVPFYGGPG